MSAIAGHDGNDEELVGRGDANTPPPHALGADCTRNDERLLRTDRGGEMDHSLASRPFPRAAESSRAPSSARKRQDKEQDQERDLKKKNVEKCCWTHQIR